MLPVEQTIHVALQVASIPAHNVSRFETAHRAGVVRRQKGVVHIICPVDSTITERRISHLSAYSHVGTQLYSSDHAASPAVELLMF